MTAGGRTSRTFVALLLGVCAVPHLIRMLGPTLAPADGFYAHGAFMLSRGYEPYVHFTQVAFPFAEQLLALAMRAFGHVLLVFEISHLLVVLAVAAALYGAGCALAGRIAGVVAAVAWSCQVWVVHYDLFERETWAALGTSLALLLYLRAGSLGWRRAAQVALALALAFVMKITAVMPAAALLLHLLVRGRVREAARLLFIYLALLAAVTCVCWRLWGDPFLWQVFLFGFFRNADHALSGSLAQLLSWTDPVLAAGFVALFVWGLPQLRAPAGAVALVLVADLLYTVQLNPVVWQHNLINLAPSCALLVGGLAAQPTRRRLIAELLLLLALIGAIAQWSGEWMAGEYGSEGPYFGGWHRDGMDRRAAFLQKYSSADEIVATSQPWWSVQAGRIEFVRYWDLQSVALGIEASLQADGLAATFGKRQGPLLLGPGLPEANPRLSRLDAYHARLLANGLQYDRPLFLAALQRSEIALVMEPLPPGILEPADLVAAGYERFEDSELGLAGWRPPHGESHPRVAELFQRHLPLPAAVPAGAVPEGH